MKEIERGIFIRTYNCLAIEVIIKKKWKAEKKNKLEITENRRKEEENKLGARKLKDLRLRVERRPKQTPCDLYPILSPLVSANINTQKYRERRWRVENVNRSEEEWASDSDISSKARD